MGGKKVPYLRDVLVEVLVYHRRLDIEACSCGWSIPASSHPEHVAKVYEDSALLRGAE